MTTTNGSAQETGLKNSFGFDPAESAHHFLVHIPRAAAGEIRISEHFTWDPDRGSSEPSLHSARDGQVRVILARPKWNAIADEVRAEFNRRLRQLGRKPGAWKPGPNLLRRELGKELVLLAWAIEEADPALIPNALANWRGLVPEERWWLYTQTAAATGHGLHDRNKGWRRALRYALTENPVLGRPPADSVVPQYFLRASGETLFGIGSEAEPTP
jgi:hypothetical protein